MSDHDRHQELQEEQTNIWAYFAFGCAILGFTNGVSFLVAVVLGHIALSKCKHEGQNGKGIAITALIISYGVFCCVTMFWILLIIYGMFF